MYALREDLTEEKWHGRNYPVKNMSKSIWAEGSPRGLPLFWAVLEKFKVHIFKYLQISSPVAVALAGTSLPLSLLLSAPLFLHIRLEVFRC